MTYNPMTDLKEFHDKFAPEQRNDFLPMKTTRRHNLIMEESREVAEAIEYLENTYFNETSSSMAEAREELAKELADLLYVVYGTAEELGIPIEEVFKVVHESNMSKVWSDGMVVRNHFGKILKPDTYVKPDLSFINEY
jgi:predicted HAD superfamily Cof-like phosphohydrolase